MLAISARGPGSSSTTRIGWDVDGWTCMGLLSTGGRSPDQSPDEGACAAKKRENPPRLPYRTSDLRAAARSGCYPGGMHDPSTASRPCDDHAPRVHALAVL